MDGKEIVETEEILEKALELVEVDRENHMLRSKHSYYDYFKMRNNQFELLQTMLLIVTQLPKKDVVTEQIADFFERLSYAVHPGNTAVIYLNELETLRKTFNQEELPKTKEEFETRANLFRLLSELERYLTLKKRFKESDVTLLKKTKRTGTTS
ncbi:hypothetical protein [Paracerasibacillus soli]|uniref:Putative aromatic acid exporter C-terminal domain-containing protein n=1 Tax=Paracerasibacillus soli TaxID=480284 RepID=A0ABU5CPT2_9BACI|nr:hypothetical protein [Virgibacillus soli]MDY0408382.1 hypothetical protein [Virgibacillus soli]